MWLYLLTHALIATSSVLLEPPAPEYSRATIDIGIVVSDLEKAVKFYRDDLGFKPTTPPGFDVPGDLAKDAGVTDGRPLHVITLRLGEGEPATTVKLMAFPDAKKSDQSLVTKGLGPRYLTLIVKDVAAVVERMKARSIPLVGKSPVLLGGRTAIAFVQDPDGNFIEFVGPMTETAGGVQRGGGAEGRDGFKPLLNGKDLAGWKPLKNAVWKVVDGVLVGEQGPDNAGGWLVTEGTYGDFELRFKFRMTKGGNSGIGFRFPAREDVSPAKVGYECQISETDPQYHTGSIFGLKKAPEGLIREGEWCDGKVIAKGTKIVTQFGGKEGVSIEDGRSASGVLGLQVHGSALYKGMKVEFKDIEIRAD